MDKTYIKKRCSKEQMVNKLRDLKISELLGDDVTELREWVNTHYVCIKKEVDDALLRFSAIQIKNPMTTAIINMV